MADRIPPAPMFTVPSFERDNEYNSSCDINIEDIPQPNNADKLPMVLDKFRAWGVVINCERLRRLAKFRDDNNKPLFPDQLKPDTYFQNYSVIGEETSPGKNKSLSPKSVPANEYYSIHPADSGWTLGLIRVEKDQAEEEVRHVEKTPYSIINPRQATIERVVLTAKGEPMVLTASGFASEETIRQLADAEPLDVITKIYPSQEPEEDSHEESSIILDDKNYVLGAIKKTVITEENTRIFNLRSSVLSGWMRTFLERYHVNDTKYLEQYLR